MTSCRRLIALLAALILAGAGPSFAGRSLTLGSGTSVEILSIAPATLASGATALSLRYRTAIPLSDSAALRKEADEIWEQLAADAERGQYEQAVIAAAPRAGAPGAAADHLFLYRKQNGLWRTSEAEGKKPKTLDATFIKSFIERADWLTNHGEFNSFLLYLAEDFTQTVSFSDQRGKPPVTLDRLQLATIGHKVYGEMSDHKYHRDILSIAIAPDGKSAEVRSRETEEETLRGQHLATIAETTDRLVFDGEVLLVKRSVSDLKSLGRDL